MTAGDEKRTSSMEEQDPRLSRAYHEARHPEPPTALDARILAAARKAVREPAPRRAGWLSWMVPASTMVVLVLAVALVLKIQNEEPARLKPGQASEAPAEAAKGPPPSPPLPQSGPPLGGAETGSGAPPARLYKYSTRAGPATERADRSDRVANVPAAPPPPLSEPAATVGAGDVTRSRTAPSSFPATGRLQGMATPPAPAASAAAGENSGVMRPSGAAAPSPARTTEGAVTQKAEALPPTEESPEQGIERIRRQLREGHEEEARRSLREFVRRYPGYPLPEDLRGLN